MIRLSIRIVGTIAILALLPWALVTSLWATAAVWAALIPDSEGVYGVGYQYEPWLTISGWVVWISVIVSFGLAVRVLFLLTAKDSSKN